MRNVLILIAIEAIAAFSHAIYRWRLKEDTDESDAGDLDGSVQYIEMALVKLIIWMVIKCWVQDMTDFSCCGDV